MKHKDPTATIPHDRTRSGQPRRRPGTAGVATRENALLAASRRPVTFAPAAAKSAPTWHLLDFKIQTQQQTNWCWLTAALSVHRWFDRTSQLTQCQVAGHMLNRADSCTNGSSSLK